jgi:hypothetical protein
MKCIVHAVEGYHLLKFGKRLKAEKIVCKPRLVQQKSLAANLLSDLLQKQLHQLDHRPPLKFCHESPKASLATHYTSPAACLARNSHVPRCRLT